MHGISSSFAPHDELRSDRSRARRVADWLRAKRAFLLLVILPSALSAIYYGFIASNQFESEAHYIVRSADSPMPTSPGLSQIFGFAGGVTGSQSESYSVSDYLSSHDAVDILARKLDLISIFRRPEVDLFSRLHPASPTAETLFKYYNHQVSVKYNSDTGITTLKVRTFRPDDSLKVVRALLNMGEQRVNALNQRAYASTIASARNQLLEAEAAVQSIQSRITGYRRESQDIDPQGTGTAQTQLVSRLRATADEARAQLMAMEGAVRGDSPQVTAMRARVRSLDAQVAAENARLTGGGGDITKGLGGYEELRVRQAFVAKRYDAAAAALEQAREQAQKQQLFIVRVVEPNLPQKALYPERLKIILSVFLTLVVAYSIGWLIVAGVKEHAG